MKKTLVFIAALVAAISCRPKAEEEYPMFWTWLEDIPSVNVEAAFAHMEEAGLDAVMLHAASVEDYVKDVELAKKHGIKVYAWVWTLNPPRQERPTMLQEHPDWFSVNRNGESVADVKAYVNSYKFLCPALPEVREYLARKVEEICAIDGVEGICLDYCRLIDCVLPISLAYNYNLRQDTEVWAEYDYGYHPAMIEKFVKEYGYDPRELQDPSRDEKWCAFRSAQITEVANIMCEVAHKAGKKVTASPFAAAGLANFMVFQDWPKWNLDMVHPMAYTDFYTMDPSFARDATLSNIKAAGPEVTVMCGVDTELGGDPEFIFDKMDAAFGAGAKGISLYTIEGLNSESLRARFKVYADSLRTLRAEGKLPVAPGTAPSVNPFENKSLMAVIERNMQRVIAGEAIHEKSVNGMIPDNPERVYPALDLSEYKLTKETDRLKVYEVTDRASGKTLQVYFVLYGDLVSGWDVRF
ncbi:MAG: family 10 glycosylhydrolase [Bacteroidales bacterium]|nr:family 10 glycosylhydrolase [Bacteroidales bacterium]